MRQAFIVGSTVGGFLYRGILAFWNFDLGLSDPLVFILALPAGKGYINLNAAEQASAQ
jgi:hypothetical protein